MAAKHAAPLSQERLFMEAVKERLHTMDKYEQFLRILKLHKEGKIKRDELVEQVQSVLHPHTDLFVRFKQFLNPTKPQPSSAPPVVAPLATNYQFHQQAPTKEPLKPRLGGRPPKPAPVVLPKPPPVTLADVAYRNAQMHHAQMLQQQKQIQQQQQRRVADEHDEQRKHSTEIDPSWVEKAHIFVREAQATLEPEVYHSFSQLLTLYTSKSIQLADLQRRATALFVNYPKLIASFNSFVDVPSRNLQPSLVTSKKRDYMGVPKKTSILRHEQQDNDDMDYSIAELEVHGERFGTSYVVIPNAARKRVTTGRDEIGVAVLNDSYLCVPSGSESYKENFKNPHADVLFRIEDDLLELDITLGRLSSLAEALRKLIQDSERTRQAPNPDNYIQDIHKVALRVALKDTYEDYMRAFRTETVKVAAEQLLARVVQQRDTWLRLKRPFKKLWQGVQQRSELRHLDQQGLTWKAFEKKRLAPKALLAEIRKVQFQAMKDSKPAPKEHLVFPLPTANAWDDVVELVQMAGKRILEPDELKSVNQFIQSFLKPFFTIERGEVSVLLGTTNFYTVIRLWEIATSRVALAKNLAQSDTSRFNYDGNTAPVVTDETQFEHEDVKAVHLSLEHDSMDVEVLSSNDLKQRDELRSSRAVLNPLVHLSPEAKMEALKKSVQKFLYGAMDPPEFEDHCIHLFGLEGFKLFVLHLTILQLVRQLVTVATSPETAEILKQHAVYFERIVSEPNQRAQNIGKYQAHMRSIIYVPTPTALQQAADPATPHGPTFKLFKFVLSDTELAITLVPSPDDIVLA